MDTELILSAVLAGESPKPTNFGLSPRTELHAKSIPPRKLTSALSSETVSKPITLLKKDVECQFTAKDPSMGASSGSAFLAFFAILEWFGLINSCFPVHAGEMELGLYPGLGGFNLKFVSAELTSRGVELSLPVRLTFLGVQKFSRNCAPRPWRLPSGAPSGAGSNLLHYHHTGGDERVNWYDDNWDDLWDEPADQ